jgi:hypothetical protein
MGSKNSNSRWTISILRVKKESLSSLLVAKPNSDNNHDNVVAEMHVEIITYCAALNFSIKQREELLEQYNGREQDLLTNLKKWKLIQEKGNGL